MHSTFLLLLAVVSAVSADRGVVFGGSVSVQEFEETAGALIACILYTCILCFAGQEIKCALQVNVYEQNQRSDQVAFTFCVKEGRR